MATTLKSYFPNAQTPQSNVAGLILGTYHPNLNQPEQGYITTNNGKSYKVKLLTLAKTQYFNKLDLNQPMLFTVYPNLWLEDCLIYSVVKIKQINNNSFAQGKAKFSVTQLVEAIFVKVKQGVTRFFNKRH